MSNRTARIAAALIGVTIGATALAGCTAAAQTEAAPETAAPAAATTPTPKGEVPEVPDGYVETAPGTYIPAGGPGECEASAYIWIGSHDDEPVHVEMYGAENLIDQGPAEMANGAVTVDEQGRPLTYTVAPGDHIARISYRFCIVSANLDSLNGYSHGAVIQPGDVLTLNADYVTDWVDPYPLP